MASIVLKMDTLKMLSLFIIFLILFFCRGSIEVLERNSAYLTKKERKYTLLFLVVIYYTPCLCFPSTITYKAAWTCYLHHSHYLLLQDQPWPQTEGIENPLLLYKLRPRKNCYWSSSPLLKLDSCSHLYDPVSQFVLEDAPILKIGNLDRNL